DKINDQCEIRDESGNFVVNCHADERDDESKQASENAGANRIQPKRRRDAAFFLDAHRRLQRVLKHTGKPTRFLLSESSGDDGVAPIDGIANYRGGLNRTIEDNRE